MSKIALIGAGGKMGCRLTDNLKNSAYEMSYVEISPAGLERLAQRNITATSAEEAVPQADVVILAVPDIYIGRVAADLLPMFQPGAIVVTLDPAAAVGGHLPKREDITYFVSHPTHPSVFNWEEDKKRHFDYFGGITAHQAIVCALMQGPEEHYPIGEELAKTMYAPVTRAHRITVEQMAILEPGLAETFLGAVMFTMREAMDEVIKMGVPKEAVFDFFMGHINIDLALCFDQIPGGVFSDACYKAIQIGKPLIFKEDWKKVLDPEHVKYQVKIMTQLPS
ncbi:phosphogluconate dehydrogenase C-terminal domain-containing protein [Runella slithyformis]|uniref:NADP oxidoreductase coenzyme F420-dependent n=1 Tax=Runella slithyformis (strain ATCC 29530 / DSM 19594 / LMG 11500 / NCIMB 11436 / LSU 4) TaxID=761193 RepID=A0A7U4E7B2_RUNSL|nr:phosphogluconate dehydrogenase C-terminal domain-containing protein [Runella slithyformis]AEI49994.1 NADP oxidoreductase coenzyme F420-dependent [Runella slithyformis DSM 19594]